MACRDRRLSKTRRTRGETLPNLSPLGEAVAFPESTATENQAPSAVICHKCPGLLNALHQPSLLHGKTNVHRTLPYKLQPKRLK
eukprot:CAMPEP_0172668978 /NCGR_PEP_ID=MMETSP1074-20121228/9399_1 /TAXON_ID=2916 /ORGANISM="Ceratium fusus, Strain PA161109" /LENGTH=83 /DNA_ID=CAMNT_0013485703 /DNA_START=496 /DNA_END=744 /DNA_ORIENTATION=-